MTPQPAPNRLSREKSPYLLQHAHNPVDWYPWGEEAFARAVAEDKPIFLSIGYATCHWCHVMERESFENDEVAALLNRDFVAVKVDREERPDIDEVYMSVCQAITGGGGWPLTIIMAPDKQPFFAATYLPRDTRQGHMGMLELLPRVATYWREQRGQALDLAERIREVLQRSPSVPHARALGPAVVSEAYQELRARYDSRDGGFGQAPKFPSPHNLMLLLRHWRRTGQADALRMVEHTLQAMRRGGVYDQIGFGLHRYSTDARWLVPHFEKMLYDQALLILAALEAHQATGDPQYAALARDTLTYVQRDMTAPEGAFYSAEDADSEGVEGKFYVWTEAELRAVLPLELAELVIRTYNATPGGNFHDEASGEATGANILHLTGPLPAAGEQLEQARQLLLAHRSQRIRPLLDDKVLTDWNGLMIAACARAAWVLNDPGYLEAATRAADFLLTRLRDADGGLLHRFRDGEAAIPAFLDDVAFLAWGLLELYQASFNPVRLTQAKGLVDHALAHFRDASGGFTTTSATHEQLLTRRREAYDGAAPSGNSAMLLNLARLARLLGAPEYEQAASDLAQAFAYEVGQTPAAHTAFLCGLDLALGEGQEIIIGGGKEEERAEMLDALRPLFLPHAVTLLLTPETAPELVALAPWLESYPTTAPHAAAYVCVGRSCHAPVSTPADLRAQLPS